ncbi:4-hydroxybenzoate polyprenyltransferase [Prochlorococcus marinus]|uniref:4-hydroxybenzoate polyprenyltransferase n=1 Tax=Prochlorococcus marinus TaxID=1219 RepID=UPI0022B3D0A3|nr:4-hydroxybenzoate polyprenyltransferase [Prochlorococcus marinus]
MNNLLTQKIGYYFQLLRWNKPSGRLILLIPAGWSLWLTPKAPPSLFVLGIITLGGLFVSGAGCIANDIWDRKFDKKVIRTKERPLANDKVSLKTAWILLILMLFFSLLIVLWIPTESRNLCLQLATLSLPFILLYPSAKRWFKYPQLILSICWGFSVLIPWAASESSLAGGVTLLFCWLATIFWTFGFDTVYAMADEIEDKVIGLNSSAISLGKKSIKTVSFCYFLTCSFLAIAAFKANLGLIFWPFWLTTTLGMQREVFLLSSRSKGIKTSVLHFSNQVRIGSLLLLGMIFSKLI